MKAQKLNSEDIRACVIWSVIIIVMVAHLGFLAGLLISEMPLYITFPSLILSQFIALRIIDKLMKKNR